jgi:hydroxyethylthiazole kinase
MDFAQRAAQGLAALRQRRPLVHNITNFVVMQSTANALLAIGASPIMAHAPEELEELLNLGSALVLNIGTLSAPWIESMRLAARLARERGLPLVLDPVGAGASRLRTRTSLELLEIGRAAVIRGNASEILALSGAAAGARGVDSAHGTEDAEDAARALAKRFGCAVAASGEVDFLTDGNESLRLWGGSPLMPQVTGMGCAASALCGAFAAGAASPLDAALGAMAAMKLAGETAAARSAGPGTLAANFCDALYALQPGDFAARLRAEAA